MQAAMASSAVATGFLELRELEDSLQWRQPTSYVAHPWQHKIKRETCLYVSAQPSGRRGSLSCCAAVLEGNLQTSHQYRSSEEIVYDVVLKQAALMAKRAAQTPSSLEQSNEEDVGSLTLDFVPEVSAEILKEAYVRCGEVCAEYAKTFYLGADSCLLGCW